MAAVRAEKSPSFLKGYKPAPDYLVRGDPARGKPSLFRARNPDGFPVIVKAWIREGAGNDADLIDIWRSEIRQLQRLAAVPKAGDLLVTMLTAASDKEGFYIVLDPASGDPLETFRSAITKPAVLAAPRIARNVACFGKTSYDSLELSNCCIRRASSIEILILEPSSVHSARSPISA